jgi:hypothetical protein
VKVCLTRYHAVVHQMYFHTVEDVRLVPGHEYGGYVFYHRHVVEVYREPWLDVMFEVLTLHPTSLQPPPHLMLIGYHVTLDFDTTLSRNYDPPFKELR